MCTKLLVLNFREPQWRSDEEKPVPACVKPELVEKSEFFESQEITQQSSQPKLSGTGGNRSSRDRHLLNKWIVFQKNFTGPYPENGRDDGGGDEGGSKAVG